ncbi:MAG TPA: ubiquinol oxidase subunit II [Sunxiuqinia sp.]|nr:ubiquinol oxidase subunit II [Sunxiuqinia sp.]
MNSLVKKRGVKIVEGTVLFLLTIFLSGCKKMVVLDPKGPVGIEQAFLIKLAFFLMLIVVIPVFAMIIWFSVRYRASNKKATYKPKWAHSNAIEVVVWGVPVLIIAVLGYICWDSTNRLDPYKPLQSENKPLEIDVISTDSDWLFIYPEYGVASINEMTFPVNTPLNFRLTSGSVMTSFFIPALGSQMYVMAGMQTKLHLMASELGTYRGENVVYSGNGYAGMHFKAISSTQQAFANWVKQTKASADTLSLDRFNQINEMYNINHPATAFSSVEPDLFKKVIKKNMHWMPEQKNMKGMSGNESAMESHSHGGMNKAVKMEE